MEVVHHEERATSNGKPTDVVAYDPEFIAKPYYAMGAMEKKAWRRGNRKLFVGAGYGFGTVGGGLMIGSVEMLKGASAMHAAHLILGFEGIITAACLIAVALGYTLANLPWEDANNL